MNNLMMRPEMTRCGIIRLNAASSPQPPAPLWKLIQPSLPIRPRVAWTLCLALLPLLHLKAEEAPASELAQAVPAELFQTALRYYRGDGVPVSEKEGLAYVKKAAKAGYPPAINHLGYCHQNGLGFLFKNDRKALLYYQEAAEAGYVPAMFNFATLKVTRRPDDGWEEAIPWFEKAAHSKLEDFDASEEEWGLYNASMAEANKRLGHYYLDAGAEGDKAKACAYFERGAALGNLNAQLNSARCYAIGIGVAVDLDKAEQFIENASRNLATRARQNSEESFTARIISPNEAYALEEDALKLGRKLVEDMQVNIARELAESDEIENNPEGALIWFQKAAEAGNKFAATRVGIFWLQGYAPGVSEEEAVEKLLASAAINHLEAHHALGCYYAHTIEEPDLEEARKHFESAAEGGFYDSARALQDPHLKSRPVFLHTTLERARKAYQSTKETDAIDLAALYSVAMDHWMGWGDTAMDRTTAAKLFQQGAERNHPHALYYTALAYFYGYLNDLNLGTLFLAKTSDKSLQLFLQAAERGSTDALYMLGILHLYGYDGAEKSSRIADRYFVELYEKGKIKEAAYGRALVHSLDGDPACDWPVALKHYIEAAGHGHPAAMVEAGRILLEGELNVPQDYAAAKTWFEQATQEAQGKNLAEAHFHLGKIHTDGLGVEATYLQGFRHFEKAALLNHMASLEIVAEAYAQGSEAVEFQPTVAARFYERLLANRQAAYLDPFLLSLWQSGDNARFNEMLDILDRAGLSSDTLSFFRAVRRSETTNRDEQRKNASRIINRIAKRGHALALAYVFKASRGIEKPNKTLRDLAPVTTIKDSPEAYFHLALCGQISDRWALPKKPHAMILEAAEAGVIEAIEHLFAALQSGESDTPEKQALMDWLTPKAKRGFPEAQELLDRILESIENESGDDETTPESASGYGSSVA